VERVIVDTGVLIGVERGELDPVVLHKRDDDICIAAVTAAELLTGVELAPDAHYVQRQEFVEDVLALVPVEDYTLEVARAHARLLAHVRRSGTPRGAHDLVVAATAAATARTVMTTDTRARFDDLPGVRAVTLS
jgi:tRNA(fMet)-specific endonuclease VapC